MNQKDVDRAFRYMTNGGVLASLIAPAHRILDQMGGWPDEAEAARSATTSFLRP